MGEIKRMWTAQSSRGQWVAPRVLRTLEAIARDSGVETLRLETNRTLTEAQELYRQEGYQEVDPFNDALTHITGSEKQLKRNSA